MSERPGYYEHLSFNAPLSERRADALAARLAAQVPADVLDVGCGWAELLLRIVAATATARGVGVDTDERVLDRGRVAARARGLEDRVELSARPGGELVEQADVVVCIGSSHAFGDTPTVALEGLRRLVRPGGRLVYGEAFWEARGAVDESLVWDDMLALPPLGGLVDLAVAAGFRPLYVETASPGEWEAFESGYLADQEEWLMTHTGHADAERVRAEADDHRRRWLHGYRNGLGFAYLTLGVPLPG